MIADQFEQKAFTFTGNEREFEEFFYQPMRPGSFQRLIDSGWVAKFIMADDKKFTGVVLFERKIKGET